MKVLVEKEFYVIERHFNVEDDSPVQGASQSFEKYHYEHGPIPTREMAKSVMQNFIKKYEIVRRVTVETWHPYEQETTGTFVLHRISSKHEESLIENDIDEVRLSIREKIVSEKTI